MKSIHFNCHYATNATILKTVLKLTIVRWIFYNFFLPKGSDPPQKWSNLPLMNAFHPVVLEILSKSMGLARRKAQSDRKHRAAPTGNGFIFQRDCSLTRCQWCESITGSKNPLWKPISHGLSSPVSLNVKLPSSALGSFTTQNGTNSGYCPKSFGVFIKTFGEIVLKMSDKNTKKPNFSVWRTKGGQTRYWKPVNLIVSGQNR